MSKKFSLSYFPFYCNEYMGKFAKYTYEEQGAFINIVCSILSSHNKCFTAEHNLSDSEKKSTNTVMRSAVEFAENIIKTQKKKIFKKSKGANIE